MTPDIVAVSRKFECAEADVVQSLVIDVVGFIRVLNQLVYRQGGIVRLDYCVRYPECDHYSITLAKFAVFVNGTV